MPRFDVNGQEKDDPDLVVSVNSLEDGSKKRKHRSSYDVACKKLKEDESFVDADSSDDGDSKTGKNGKKRPDQGPKMKTLDELFANMRKPPSSGKPKVSLPIKSQSSSDIIEIASPVQSKGATDDIVEIISPKKSKKVSNIVEISPLVKSKGKTASRAYSKKASNIVEISPPVKSNKNSKDVGKTASCAKSKKTSDIIIISSPAPAKSKESSCVVDLTSPEPPKKVLKISSKRKSAPNSSSSKSKSAKRKLKIVMRKKRTRESNSSSGVSSDCAEICEEDNTAKETQNEGSDKPVSDESSQLGKSRRGRKRSQLSKKGSNAKDTNPSTLTNHASSKTEKDASVTSTNSKKPIPNGTSKKKMIHPLMEHPSKLIKKKELHPLMKPKPLNSNRKPLRKSSKDDMQRSPRRSRDSKECQSQKKYEVIDVESIIPTEKSIKAQKNKRRRCSDGVICVGEVKNQPKVENPPKASKFIDITEKRKENYGLSALPCETVLWTQKYEPQNSNEVIGNEVGVKNLTVWLKEWKLRWEKEKEEAENLNHGNGDDSDSDFELDNEDKAQLKKEERETFSKVAVLIGPCGCGKTASVFASATELNFKVLEMSASTNRSSKQILSQLHEATLSHQVSKSSAFNFFKISDSNKKKFHGDSLILLKDADVLFEDDKYFWSAVDTLITDTKRPIILTTSDSNILTNLEKRFEKIYFHYPSVKNQFKVVQNIAKNEHFEVTEDRNCDFKMTNALLHYDVRKTIHSLHFWGSGCKPTPNKTPSKGRKGRRGRRSASVEAGEQKTSLNDLFTKFAGLSDSMSKVQSLIGSTKSFASSLCSTLMSSVEDDDNKIEYTEAVVSQMLFSSLPPVLRINWWHLMLCYRDSPPNTVGRTPLEIHTPTISIDTERDFLYDYSSDECKIFGEQDIDVDLLKDDDSCESRERSSLEKIAGIEKPGITESDMTTLDIISKTADLMSIVDRIHNSSCKITKRDDAYSIDSTRCKVSQGLLDRFSSETELSYHSMAATHDLLSSLEVRSIMSANSRLSKIQKLSDKTCQPDKLSLQLPHECQMLKTNQYIRRSLQSQFVGGSFVTSQSFTTDFMPVIRSIVRCEQRRKEAKNSRRFMHYFDTIRVFPRQSELTRLLNDFKEIEPDSK